MPSDKVMVVYGRTDKGKASRTIHGGAALVWPLIQDYALPNINTNHNQYRSKERSFAPEYPN